jgi:hypothetical protein
MRGSRSGLKPLVASGAYNLEAACHQGRTTAANEGIQRVKRVMIEGRHD